MRSNEPFDPSLQIVLRSNLIVRASSRRKISGNKKSGRWLEQPVIPRRESHSELENIQCAKIADCLTKAALGQDAPAF